MMSAAVRRTDVARRPLTVLIIILIRLLLLLLLLLLRGTKQLVDVRVGDVVSKITDVRRRTTATTAQ